MNSRETKEKNNNYSIYKVLIGSVLVLFSFLVTYRTIYPTNRTSVEEIFNADRFKPEEFILENDKIAMTINLRGAMLEHFYFKEDRHYLLQDNSNNCFETVWISKSNKFSLPGRNTLWRVQNINKINDKSVITLSTDLNGVKFLKTITIDEYQVTLEDSVNNIPSSYLDMDGDMLSYGGFSCSKQQQDNLEFISYLNNKKKVLRVVNKTLQKDGKQKISNHDGILGIENNFFTAICEVDTKQGNIFLQNSTQNNEVNQMFFLSSGTIYKVYKLYLLPKKPVLLAKYGFDKLINYGTFLFPLTYGLSVLLNWLLERVSGIMALVLVALFIIFSNIYLIVMVEKEKYKLKLNDKEKKSIEANYTGKELEQQLAKFYKQHDIKMLRILLLPILMSFSWFTLNWAIGLSFSLRKQSFLWLTDLSLQDSYSVLNLYGLLNFSPTLVPFYNYLASDVLSICSALFMILQTNQVLENNKSNGTASTTTVPNNLLMVIHYILFLSMCKSVSSGFVVCFLIISLGNFLVSKSVRNYMSTSKRSE